MQRQILFFVLCLVLLFGGTTSRMTEDNTVWEDLMRSDGGSEPELEESGPEKMSMMEMLPLRVEEEAVKGRLESEVDEETIRKAEKMAEKDLLNGLNRILRNNETLKDVLRAENV